MRHILTGFILFSIRITSGSAFYISPLKHKSFTQLIPARNFRTEVMTTKASNVMCLMSHFRNRRNLLIRTYKAGIANPKASIVLVHGNRSHFRAEYCAYNLKWHLETHAIGIPQTEDIVKEERKAIYPANAGKMEKNPNAKFPDAFTLDGRNPFDISPRFIYDGSFVQKLNDLGFDVYGLDLQSNGMSEGLHGRRNYYSNIEDHVEDVIQFIDIVKRGMFDNTSETYNKDKIGSLSSIGKVYLGGLSMGGNIVLRVAQKSSVYRRGNRNFIDALMAFAPMTDLSSYTEGVVRKIQLGIIKVFSLFNPSCTIFLAEDRLARSMHRFFRSNDPHFFIDTQCYAVVLSLFAATDRLIKHYDQYPLDLPTILFHATYDDTCSIQGSRAVANIHLKDHKDLQFYEVEGSVHCLTSPMYVDNIMPKIKAWIQRLQG